MTYYSNFMRLYEAIYETKSMTQRESTEVKLEMI